MRPSSALAAWARPLGFSVPSRPPPSLLAVGAATAVVNGRSPAGAAGGDGVGGPSFGAGAMVMLASASALSSASSSSSEADGSAAVCEWLDAASFEEQASPSSAAAAAAAAAAVRRPSAEEVVEVDEDLAEFRARFRLGRKLGSGRSAAVFLVTERVSPFHRFAAKVVGKDSPHNLAVRNEVSLLAMTGRHDNVVGLEAFYETSDSYVVVMDLIDGCELFELIAGDGPLSEDEARPMFRDVLAAVGHLHESGICHADIKPENLLVGGRVSGGGSKGGDSENRRGEVPRRALLTDFGLARQLHPGRRALSVFSRSEGTMAYWSPEVILGRPADGRLVDMWAVGCVLYIMLCGVHPFDPAGSGGELEIIALAAEGAFDEDNERWRRLSPEAQSLIRGLLQVSQFACGPAGWLTGAMRHLLVCLACLLIVRYGSNLEL